MWNLKYDTNELIYKTVTDTENRLVVANDAEQGPVELLGTKPFYVPLFFDYRKQALFSLHDLP